MSVDSIKRIADTFAQKVSHMDRVPDPLGVLADFSAELARNNAEFVFFKVQTEPGWTVETGQALADKMMHEHVISIADVLHAAGGTIEMAQDLAKVAATAYGTRLAELSAAYGQGGAA